MNSQTLPDRANGTQVGDVGWWRGVRTLVVGLLVMWAMGSGGLIGVAAGSVKDDAERGIRAVVTVAPLRGLIEPLLPPGSTVTVLIPPGVSEHGYEFPPATLASVARADLIVTVGLGLEPAVERFLASNPPRGERRHVRFEDAAKEEIARFQSEGHEGHDHGPGETCEHGHVHAVDPHLWLDPIVCKALVRAVGEAVRELTSSGPGGAASAWDPGVERVLATLDAVDAAYGQVLRDAKLPRRTLVVAHDAYGWMARRYGLKVVAVAGLTAGEPTPAAIQRAVRTVREEKVTTVFAEPQLSSSGAKRVAEAAGAKVAMLDPLGNGDYFGLMRGNLASLARALGGDEALALSASPEMVRMVVEGQAGAAGTP